MNTFVITTYIKKLNIIRSKNFPGTISSLIFSLFSLCSKARHSFLFCFHGLLRSTVIMASNSPVLPGYQTLFKVQLYIVYTYNSFHP